MKFLSGGKGDYPKCNGKEFNAYRRFCEYSTLENKIIFYTTLRAIKLFKEFEEEEFIPASEYIDVNVISQRILILFAKHLKTLITDAMYTNDDQILWRALDRVLKLDDDINVTYVFLRLLQREPDIQDKLLYLCNLYLTEQSEPIYEKINRGAKHSLYFYMEGDSFNRLIAELSVAEFSKTRADDIYINSGVLRDRFVMTLLVGFINNLDFFRLLDPIKVNVTSINEFG